MLTLLPYLAPQIVLAQTVLFRAVDFACTMLALRAFTRWRQLKSSARAVRVAWLLTYVVPFAFMMLPLTSFIDVRDAVGQKTLSIMQSVCDLGGQTAANACSKFLHAPCPAKCSDVPPLFVLAIETVLGAAFAGQSFQLLIPLVIGVFPGVRNAAALIDEILPENPFMRLLKNAVPAVHTPILLAFISIAYQVFATSELCIVLFCFVAMNLAPFVVGACRATPRWTQARKEGLYRGVLALAMLGLTADFLRRRYLVLAIIAEKANVAALLAANWQSVLVMLVNSLASSMLTKVALVDMLLVGTLELAEELQVRAPMAICMRVCAPRWTYGYSNGAACHPCRCRA